MIVCASGVNSKSDHKIFGFHLKMEIAVGTLLAGAAAGGTLLARKEHQGDGTYAQDLAIAKAMGG